MGFDEALAEAQALGYAEADPSADVDGGDAASK
ncbi:MAG: homoserine dehydrogenase, partial [Halohasta sp.]